MFALLAEDQDEHEAAVGALVALQEEELVTHNYVIVEATALVGRRLGAGAARALHESLLAPLKVMWIERSTHEAALAAYLASSRRGPSLVDYASFELMRRNGIRRAFAFDRDFRTAGYAVIP